MSVPWDWVQVCVYHSGQGCKRWTPKLTAVGIQGGVSKWMVVGKVGRA